MSRKLYQFDLISELGRRGTNVTYEARDTMEGSGRTIFEWNPPTTDSNTVARIEAAKADIGEAEIFTDRSSYYLAIKPERAKSTLTILRSRGLFTGPWAELFEAETPPPPPVQQPKPNSKWWIFFALAAVVAIGALVFWLANRPLLVQHTPRGSLPPGQPPGGPARRPTITSFSANKTQIVAGQSIEFRWNVLDSDTVSLEPGYPSLDPNSTSVNVTPTKTTAYTLVAKKADARVTSDTVTVYVVAPPPPRPLPLTIRFYSETATVPYGKSTKLIWKTENATTVRIEPTFDDVSPQGGIVTVSPAETTQYTLTAIGASGPKAATVTIGVVPDIQMFKSEALQVRGCDASLLRWHVLGATSISVDQGIGRTDLLSRLVRPPESTIYTLTAVRAGKSATAQTGVSGFPVGNAACPAGLK